MSTVVSESAFSTGGRFVSPSHNHIHPKTLEALMCATDWIWSFIESEGVFSFFCIVLVNIKRGFFIFYANLFILFLSDDGEVVSYCHTPSVDYGDGDVEDGPKS